ncbi:TPA: M50 family metallopeptidase [Candidatus Woesearchaeota archaeon]|nr:M50 family metallopeptidase [Candidatus Woesearchaeota archaeon]
MAFFSVNEIIDITVMTLALGFIFKDVFGSRFHMPGDKRKQAEDPVEYYRSLGKRTSVSAGFKTAIYVAAPAVILHEIGHKVMAMSYGLSAEFNAAYFWLGLAVLLRLMNFGFVFFVPAYVSIYGQMTPLESSIVAFAGPAVNLILFLGAWGLMKNKRFVKRYKQYLPVIWLTSRINLLLFVFNMLPIPMFDGWKVFSGLYYAFF